MNKQFHQLITQKRIIVCCGAGGVGKTSIAAAIAMAAARKKRKVLVVTIDPSKRLAETIGVSQNLPEPTSLSPEALAQARIENPGSIDAWMLDPQVIADNVVNRFAKNKKEAQQLLNNRIYKNVTAMVAGMQEYTAVQAMHDFILQKKYDLIVLDTPPSRNALHFLDAPGRITRFLDGRVFRFFLPSEDSLIKKATSKILYKVMDAVFGEDTRIELMNFFTLFSSILLRVNKNAEELRSFFKRSDASFVVVTSPAQEALEEAYYFEDKTKNELQLPLHGFILNRSYSETIFAQDMLDNHLIAVHISEPAKRALLALAEKEANIAKQHNAIFTDLQNRMDNSGSVLAMPYISEGINDIASLIKLVQHIEQ